MMNTRIPILRYCSSLSVLANELLVAMKDQKGFGRTERNNLKYRDGHPTIEPMLMPGSRPKGAYNCIQ
jgi:hypothetical protein